ncbi:hypothetical protein ACH492_22250 [Streptomyces sp. NPDC019443]|uniref:hypothetical protein n=1 Tax=Streptomyces sp. NPDC019443 TaxID=3365061 RepID=UPI0037A73C99
MADQELTCAPSRTVRMVDSDPDASEALRRVRASNIATTPATVAACRSDYEAAADVRANLDRQLRRR